MKAQKHYPGPSVRRIAVFAFCLFSAVLISVGYRYFQFELAEITRENYRDLAAIGDLKSDQIKRWRASLQREAYRLAHDLFVRNALEGFLRAPNAENHRADLQELLELEAKAGEASGVLLLAANGAQLLAAGESISMPSAPALVRAVTESLANQHVVVSDLYRGQDGEIYVDVIDVICDENGPPLAVVVVRNKASAYLFPLIQSWPTSSPSGETLLVQRDGDDVLFLNELRHRPCSALNLRTPLSQSNVAAVQAVLGKKGICEGVDYRGVTVLSDLRAIPASPWFVISKVDSREVFSEVRYRAVGIGLIIGAFILLAAAISAYLCRRHEADVARKAAEIRISRLTQLYAALAQCNQAISHAACVEDLLPTICRIAAEYGGMSMAWIGLVDDSCGEVRLAASFGSGAEYLEGIQISLDAEDPLGRGPTGTAIRENRPFWCTDFQNDPSTSPWHERGAQFGWAACASLPLCQDGKPVGTLTIYTDQPDAFDEESRSLLVEMASDISFALDSFAHQVERKRAEEALKQNRNMLEHILNSVPQSVFWKDRNSVYLGCNAVFAKLVGLDDPEKIVGKTDDDLPSTPDAKASYLADDRTVMESNRPKAHIIEQAQRADKTSFWIDTTKVPLVDPSGRVYGVLGIFDDITERMEAEGLLREKTSEMERFAYAVSHDLKSPVVTIQTFLGYLEKDLRVQNADAAAKDLGFIHGAADKMELLLGELLALARVGHSKNEPVEVPLREIVDAAMVLVAGQISRRGVRVEVTPEPVFLFGERPRLVQVFQNLLDNAAKFFGEQPDPRVEIGAESEGGKIVLFVRDNGQGIDPRHKSKLFGLFEKLDPYSPGVGMGLAMVRRIVEAHGGQIIAQSDGLGKGTTFRFTLAKTKLTRD